MPGLMKYSLWGRLVWMSQLVIAGIRELEPHERRHARELVAKLYRERRLGSKDREHLAKMARKVGRGASRSATPRMFRRR